MFDLTRVKTYAILRDEFGSHHLINAGHYEGVMDFPALQVALEKLFEFIDPEEYTVKIVDVTGEELVANLPEEAQQTIDDLVQISNDLEDYGDEELLEEFE